MVNEVNDIRVKSWLHLIEILYDIPRDVHNRHRSDLVYRGVADKRWDLKTSLIRLGGDYIKVERPLVRSFHKYAEPGQLPKAGSWIELAIAQHHGLPTRLLDWTVSPQVALHFATAEPNNYDKDAAVWCVDVAEARSILPQKLRDFLKRESAYLFSVEMLDRISNLNDFDKWRNESEFVLFFEPPSIDARIVNQGAILSVMPGADLVLSDFLINHPNLYKRVIIPKELKWEIRDKLDQDNMTERTLFPGLDGLGRWLKRYYGPGPERKGKDLSS